MKFVVFGNLELAIRCATGLLDAGAQVSAFVAMSEATRRDNSADVADFAASRNIPYHEIEDVNSPGSASSVRGYSPDYLLFVWPQMVKQEVLEIPRNYCIGTHPTALPFNRGRHPLHWLITLGIRESMMSFFRLEEKADTGNVLLQVPYQIDPEQSIAEANAAMEAAAYKGSISLCQKLMEAHAYQGVEQDQALANYWRKRTPHDVTLDPRMSSDMIIRTVRSYSPPYPCANLIFEDAVLKIDNAVVSEISSQMESEQLQRIEPGKVIFIQGNTIGLKVDDAIVKLRCSGPIPSKLQRAKYIHPPTRYVAQHPSLLPD